VKKIYEADFYANDTSTFRADERFLLRTKNGQEEQSGLPLPIRTRFIRCFRDHGQGRHGPSVC